MELHINTLSWQPRGAAQALVDIPNLNLKSGAFLALGGPSGSGKSSLIMLLAGIRTASTGQVSWNGLDIMALGESQRDAWRRQHLGLIFQDFRLVEELSALDNVLLPLSFISWKPSKTQIIHAIGLLESVGITQASQITATLSRGEMQRVALARALIFSPKIILADEPTASLDAKSEQAVADLLIRTVRQTGATLILSTHHPDLKAQADQVIELEHGRISTHRSKS